MSDKAAMGSGLAFITLAKLYFIATSFLVQVGLPRLLGAPEVFGQYTLAMSIASVVDNVLIASTVQSVSKRVSEDDALAPVRLRQALKIQLGVGLFVAGGLFALSPLLADLAYDPSLTLLLRIAAAVPLCYALYAALVGSLNGRRLFRKQASLDMIFSSVRTVGILGAAAAGLGAQGALSGFAAAAAAILVVALAGVGTGQKGPGLSLRTWFGFLLPIAAFQLMLNGMLLLDVWVLKNTTAGLGIEAGMPVREATEQASALVGYYRAAQNFALVPYQIMLSVTFVVFPLVSRTTASGDIASARHYVRDALRFSLIVLFALATPIAASAEALIRLAYGVDFLPSQDTLHVLVFGQISLALFVIVATTLSGASRPGTSAWIGAVALLVMLSANRFLVRAVGLGDLTLTAAAIATSAGPFLALLLGSAILNRLFQVRLPWLTLLRCAAAAAASVWVGKLLPQHSAWMAPPVMLAAGLLYLLLIVLNGELKKSDLSPLLQRFARTRHDP